jgi:cytosine deaminase
VNLCFGQDNVADGFYPFGRGDMLEIAFLAAHAAHLTSAVDLQFVLDAVTSAPARVWGESGHSLREGARADLVLFRSNRWEDVLREQQPPYLVFSKGRLVAKTTVSTEIGGHVCA